LINTVVNVLQSSIECFLGSFAYVRSVHIFKILKTKIIEKPLVMNIILSYFIILLSWKVLTYSHTFYPTFIQCIRFLWSWFLPRFTVSWRNFYSPWSKRPWLAIISRLISFNIFLQSLSKRIRWVTEWFIYFSLCVSAGTNWTSSHHPVLLLKIINKLYIKVSFISF